MRPASGLRRERPRLHCQPPWSNFQLPAAGLPAL